MSDMTASQIRDRLAKIRAAMDRIIDGGVAEFRLDDGDRAQMLSLAELRQLESTYEIKLARLTRGRAPRFGRAWRY